MENSEIFRKAGLTICVWDEQQDEYFPLAQAGHKIIFKVLMDTERLSVTEKILILAGVTRCDEVEDK